MTHSQAILAFIITFGALVCMTTLFIYYRVKGATSEVLQRTIDSAWLKMGPALAMLDDAIKRRRTRHWDYRDLEDIRLELTAVYNRLGKDRP